MTNSLDTLPAELHRLNLGIIHQFNNFSYFYLIFSPHVTNWILSILTSQKLLIQFPTHIYFTNFCMFNIGGELWSWFLAYVTNRSQFVSINGYNSSLLPVESGVPQRNILGPLLFIIYMNDIPSAVAHSKVFLFADDTNCSYHSS